MWSSCQCPWSGGCVDAISMWWTVNIGIEDGGDGMVVVWICMEEREIFFKIIHSFFFYFFFSLFLPKTFPWQIFLSWFSLQKILDFFSLFFHSRLGIKAVNMSEPCTLVDGSTLLLEESEGEDNWHLYTCGLNWDR